MPGLRLGERRVGTVRGTRSGCPERFPRRCPVREVIGDGEGPNRMTSPTLIISFITFLGL